MPHLDKKSGLITTDDNYTIMFRGNYVNISKDNNKLTLVYERLMGGSIVIYKDSKKNSIISDELLNILDKTLKELKFSYEIS